MTGSTHAPLSYSGHQTSPLHIPVNEAPYVDPSHSVTCQGAPFSPSHSSLGQGRRKLPTPATALTQAEISIDFAIEIERQQLVVTLITARGFTCNTQAFIHLEILPLEQ